MREALYAVAVFAVVMHLIMVAIVVWRIWRGETMIDRLIGSDLATTFLLSALVLLAILRRDAIYIDVALALAALGFVTSIVLAKYLADEEMF
jgi:multisubunit Na+/H+ antiporter MnhF subunit